MDFRERHVDASLTNFALGYSTKGFIAEFVCPVIPVAKKKNLYPVFGTENLKDFDTLRDKKAPGKTWDQSMSTTTYDCKPHSMGRGINDDDREAVPNGGNLEMEIVTGNMSILQIRQEREVASLFTTEANYASSDYYRTLSGTNQWNDPGGTSDPKGDVVAGVSQVRRGTFGNPANAIILPWDVAVTLSTHPKIIAEIKYTNAKLLESIDLPAKLWGLQTIIAGSMYDAKREGQSGSTPTDIWGDSVCIFYLDPTIAWFSVTFAKTFRHGQLGYYVRRIPNPELLANYELIETVDEGRDSKLIANTAGYLLSDVLQ